MLQSRSLTEVIIHLLTVQKMCCCMYNQNRVDIRLTTIHVTAPSPQYKVDFLNNFYKMYFYRTIVPQAIYIMTY